MSEFTEPYAIHSCPARTVKPAADFDRPAHQGFPGIPSRCESHPHLHQTQSKIKSTSQPQYKVAFGSQLGLPRGCQFGIYKVPSQGEREGAGKPGAHSLLHRLCHRSVRKEFPSPSSGTHVQKGVSGFLSLR